MAHPFSDFLKFMGTDFERYILPIIPRGAKLAKQSNLSEDQLGKIPGRWLAEERAWVGFKDWPNHHVYTNASNLKHYERWQTESGTSVAVGMNTNVFNAVDIDSDSPEIADIIECYTAMDLGMTPVVRLRDGSARRVLLYERDQHTAPTMKRRLTFKEADGTEHAVEFLARGQQVVIEGPHAKGQMYSWRTSGLLQNREWLSANLITADRVDSLFRALERWVEETEGLERVRLALPGGGNRGIAVKIEPASIHVASDKEILANAIKAIDINHPSLDYDAWCLLFRAMWAACGGERAFYAEHILPWLLGYPENKEEEMEAKLASFRDSQVGAEYVYRIAADFGYTEGRDALTEELFRNLADQSGYAEGASSDAGGADGVPLLPPVGNGPDGPTPPNDTHWQLAAAFIAQQGVKWRYNVDAKSWYGFNGLVWDPRDNMHDVVGAMLAGLGVQIYQTVAGPGGERRFRALQSDGTINAVVRLMQSQLIARDSEFDAHPHLLNTPIGVFDLRTGARMDHDPALLIRKITLVAPDFNPMVDYERRCSRFFGDCETLPAAAHG